MKKSNLLLAAVLCSPLTAIADIITVDYTGLVTDLGSALSGDGVSLGDTVNGSFSYDTSMAPSDSLSSFTLSIGSFSAALDGGSTYFNVQNDQMNGSATLPADGFNLGGSGINSGLNGNTTAAMQFGVLRQNIDGQLWSDTLLPDLSDWLNITLDDMNFAGWRWLDFGLITDNFQDDQLRWNVESFNVTSTSAVPLPAAVWLFGAGLVSLVSVARRKQSI